MPKDVNDGFPSWPLHKPRPQRDPCKAFKTHKGRPDHVFGAFSLETSHHPSAGSQPRITARSYRQIVSDVLSISGKLIRRNTALETIYEKIAASPEFERSKGGA